ncbi:DDHD domain-containing [Cryptosporidium sp. chipmunk genotype I]|uniref:DDHD domain-containing n=1 Tax=Cryptosporidium sp. chipmunk genotype I TaxID=1280935 RepID=UPI00351A1E38|nr:DDHD domain-containing [Cryptosporidium sp. chipmunk genotype I]
MLTEFKNQHEKKISIDFTIQDFIESDTLIQADCHPRQSIEKFVEEFDNLFSVIPKNEQTSFVTGCRDSFIIDKKHSTQKGTSKKKGFNTSLSAVSNLIPSEANVKRDDYNLSSSSNAESQTRRNKTNRLGVGQRKKKKIRFNSNSKESFQENSDSFQNDSPSGPNNRFLKYEDFSPSNSHKETLVNENFSPEQFSPLSEKKLPIIDGYGPFSPRKSKQPPHIMLIVHGIGSNESAINKNREEFVHQLESVKAHWFWEVDIDITVDAVDWKSKLASVQDHMFDRITLPQHRENRMLLNKTIGDVMYFMVPRYGDYIIAEVAKQLNQKIKQYKSKISEKPKIVLIGHSLGSVIVYELVSRQQTRITKSEIPKLDFDVDHLFLWGSPLPAMLVMMFPEYLRSGLTLPKGLAPIQPNESFSGGNFLLNKCPELKIYNVFHPYDPVAFRLEPLLYPNLVSLPDPVLLPYWRNLSKRTYHQWDKEMENARKALYESISGITSSISNAVLGGILGWGGVNEYKSTLEVNLVPRDQKIKQLRDESVISKFKTKFSASRKTGAFSGINFSNSSERQLKAHSNSERRESESVNFSLLKTNEVPGIPIRVDYQLQEGTTEHYISSLAFLQSHFNYWKSRDLGFFILWKIIEDFEPVISFDDYKAALEHLKQDQTGLDNLDSSSEISDDSSYNEIESD